MDYVGLVLTHTHVLLLGWFIHVHSQYDRGEMARYICSWIDEPKLNQQTYWQSAP